MSTARLFTHGGSQALRLPKEFRFEGTEVHLRRAGRDVIISPQAAVGIAGLIAALDDFEPGLRLQREQPDHDERAELLPVRPPA